MEERNVFWSSVRWPGCEHLRVRADAGGVMLDGLVLALRDGPQRIAYQIHCDAGWTVRSLEVRRLNGDGHLVAKSDGEGHWRLGDGTAASELDGCIDVDLAITPATNTLPIRRLRLGPGRSAQIAAAYIEFPSLRFRAASQRYTRLDDRDQSPLFRYESATFRADLPVDDFGLVLDYPGIWERIAAC